MLHHIKHYWKVVPRHNAVITIGGLGPTTDDCTRDAVSAVIQKPLHFHAPSWEYIAKRFAARQLPLTDNNRQQAYFPEGATVLENQHGSANGAAMTYQDKWIFMLPGPPNECLPMFEQYVIPQLTHAGFGSNKRLYRWRLTGVSESFMAEQLEAFGKPYQLQFGYRAYRPYLDIKLHLPDSPETHAILEKLLPLLKPYLA